MVKVVFHSAFGGVCEIETPAGDSLMRAAKDNGVEGIVAECGGSQVCGTCLVYVREPWFSRLPAPNELEAEMVEYAMHPHPRGRLSCQIELTGELDGMEVETPLSQR
jgi:2Fe-2S ferredoxin